MRYAVIDAATLIINIILWDGVAPYDPGEGNALVADTDPPTAQIGGTYSGGEFHPPV